MKAVWIVLIAVVVAYALYHAYELHRPVPAPEQSTHGDYAREADQAVNRYQSMLMDSRSTKVDVCVQAGIVSSAYLQAQDEPNYTKWKAIQKSDCEKAGVPVPQ
jgi:hypothetical protein